MFRVRTVFSGMPGAPYLNTLYFHDNLPIGVTPQQCVAAVGAFWGAVDNLLANTLSWSTEADVATVDEVTGDVTASTGTTPVSGAGGLAAAATSTSVQGLVRWTTGAYIAGRQIRGRSFIPGINAGNQSGNAPASSLVTAVNTAAAALIDNAETTLMVWSRKNAVDAAVTGGAMWTTLAVLRSRRD